MESRIDSTAAALRSRGILLRKPASEEALRDLSLAFGTRIGFDFRSVYNIFDGFEDYDYRSQIVIWPIEEIKNFREKNGEMDIQKELWCIGDFLIDSDYIAMQIEADISEVILLNERKTLGKSMHIFLDSLLEGKLDFLP